MSTPDGESPPNGSDGGGPEGGGPAVKDRWWVDTGDKKRERAVAAPRPPVGSRLYRSGVGFDQDKAKSRLTDNNLKLLREANPEGGKWAYLLLADKPHREQNRDRIVEQVTLPPYAHGVVVDCGRTLRLLVTGTPMGDRLLDLTLSEPPSFDAWIEGDWVRERVFRDQRSALSGFRRYIAEFLSPEGIAAWEAMRARV
jgi:hypothetical protein